MTTMLTLKYTWLDRIVACQLRGERCMLANTLPALLHKLDLSGTQVTASAVKKTDPHTTTVFFIGCTMPA